MRAIKGTLTVLQVICLVSSFMLIGGQLPVQAITHTKAPIFADQTNRLVHRSVYYTLDEASSLITQKQYAEAIRLLNGAAERDPVNIFIHFNLGFCYLEMAKIAQENGSQQRVIGHKSRVEVLLSKAEYHFQRVQNLNPDLSVSYFKLGKIALMLNDSDKAIAYYKDGLELEPESAPLAFNLGRVYDQQNKPEKAIEMYQRAIKMDARFVYAYNNLGLLYEGQKNFSSAEKVYMSALKQDPSYNYARLNLGNLYAELGKLPEARHQYEEAIRIEPSNSWAHLYLGNVQFLSGNYQAATRSYQASIALNPEFSTAYYLLAVSLSKQQKLDEAMSASLQYMNLEPDGKYSEQLRGLIGSMKAQKTAMPSLMRPSDQ